MKRLVKFNIMTHVNDKNAIKAIVCFLYKLEQIDGMSFHLKVFIS